MSTTLDSALVAELAGRVSGPVLGPHDAGYDAARAVHNGLVDRRPALIVRCRTTKSMSEREQSLGLAKGSEVEFQTELNVTTGSGGPNLAKGAV